MSAPLPSPAELRLAASPDRIALARRTHRSVIRTSALIFAVISAVILLAGLVVAHRLTNAAGVCMVAGAFLLVPILFGLSVRKAERRAELFLAADGTTVVRADAHGVGVAGVEIPYGRITCLFANVEQEHYSSGGRFGDGAAPVSAGIAAGSVLGTGLRRRLFRDGAKSAVFLCIGVDKKTSLAARAGMVEKVPLAPQRGDDPGRIVVPFGAYLGLAELQALLEFVQQQTGGQLFPMGVVTGAMNWASAQVVPSSTRSEIWAESKGMLP